MLTVYCTKIISESPGDWTFERVNGDNRDQFLKVKTGDTAPSTPATRKAFCGYWTFDTEADKEAAKRFLSHYMLERPEGWLIMRSHISKDLYLYNLHSQESGPDTIEKKAKLEEFVAWQTAHGTSPKPNGPFEPSVAYGRRKVWCGRASVRYDSLRI